VELLPAGMDPSIHSNVFARHERGVLEIEHCVDDVRNFTHPSKGMYTIIRKPQINGFPLMLVGYGASRPNRIGRSQTYNVMHCWRQASSACAPRFEPGLDSEKLSGAAVIEMATGDTTVGSTPISVVFTPTGPLVYQWQIDYRTAQDC
jgi:hypothetical protein